jgi:hypothetical protein
MTDEMLDEALIRLHDTGPERDGWLSNHAPMAVEVLTRRGHGEDVQHWIDGYRDRLEAAPRGIAPIAPEEWRDPLGDPVRTGDWLAFFATAVHQAPWRDVLATWWPRLLPGIAAGATHGVIRVGHAVRSLLEEETGPRVAELGQGLAYWAARWQPLSPVGGGPYGAMDPRAALDAVPRVPDQRFGIRHRLAQLADLPGWAAAGAATPGDGSVEDRLAGIVAAAVHRHVSDGYANPIMLVHAATAPTAVLRALPALSPALALPSLHAAWAASAAITAAYAPPHTTTPPHTTASPHTTAPPHTTASAHPSGGTLARTTAEPDHPVARTRTDGGGRGAAWDPQEVMDRAVRSGDPHAIKFADAALDVWRRDADPAALAAADHATTLIAAD